MMQMKSPVAIIVMVCCILIAGCSKKHQPQSAVTETAEPVANKPVITRTKLPPLPKVLSIDDRAAKKSVDGRLYYDLQGKRYWRNYNDGKYYLFNKAMYKNPAFKPH